MDWGAYADQESDYQRTWDIFNDLLPDLQPEGPGDTPLGMLQAALGYAYFLPEGRARAQSDRWLADAMTQALAGDGVAADRVTAHLTAASALSAPPADACVMALVAAAFARAGGAPQAAAGALARAYAVFLLLPLPRLVEVATLGWCIAMALLADRTPDLGVQERFALNGMAQRFQQQLEDRGQPRDEDGGNFFAVVHGMNRVLVSLAGYLAASGARGWPVRPDPISLTVADDFDQMTAQRWPVTPWVTRVFER